MKSHNCIDTIELSPAPTSFGRPPWIRQVMHRVARWIETSRQRRQLAALDDAALKDIGLTRSDVSIEIYKPFWRP